MINDVDDVDVKMMIVMNHNPFEDDDSDDSDESKSLWITKDMSWNRDRATLDQSG